ncbi:MAG: hypothetical protein ACRETY_10050 [Steroidobacteraceae bacterium]
MERPRASSRSSNHYLKDGPLPAMPRVLACETGADIWHPTMTGRAPAAQKAAQRLAIFADRIRRTLGFGATESIWGEWLMEAMAASDFGGRSLARPDVAARHGVHEVARGIAADEVGRGQIMGLHNW